MTTKRFFAKDEKKITNNCIAKYHLDISDMITNLNIENGDDAESLITDLESFHTILNKIYINLLNKNKLSSKIIENKIQKLERVIHNISALNVRFRMEEEGLDDPNTEYEYEDIIEDFEDDIREELLCI